MSTININRVVLTGNLTRDPELHPTSSGTPVCKLRIACNGRRRSSDGDYEPKPNFVTVTLFGTQAENANRYLEKGRPVAIDGHLDWREWEDPDGKPRQSLDVIADAVQFLGAPQPASDKDAAPTNSSSVPSDRRPRRASARQRTTQERLPWAA